MAHAKKLGLFLKCVHTKRCLVKQSCSTSQLATLLSIQTSKLIPQKPGSFSPIKSCVSSICVSFQYLINFHKLQSIIPLLFKNLVTKPNYSTNTSILCFLLAVLYFLLSMNFLHLTSDVFNALHSLNPSKATGCDNIALIF